MSPLPSYCSLEVVGGDEYGNLGDVSPQQHPLLQLAHLHLGLQRGGTGHGAHQHQLARLPVRALHGEVATRSAATQQREAQRVPDHAHGRDAEHDARCRQVGHHRQVVVGDGVGGLGARAVVQGTRVPLAASREGWKDGRGKKHHTSLE